jgi:WD40 repeat protein
MRLKQRKQTPIILVAIILMLTLTGMACNLFGGQPSGPEVVVEEEVVLEEPEPIEEPETEDEPGFRPEQVFRFDLEEKVNSVAYANRGEQIATGIFTQVDIWNASDGALMESLEEVPHSVIGLAFTPDDQAVYAALGVGGINLYTLGNNEPTIDFHRGYDNYLALSPDGTRIASGNRGGETWLWDVSTGELIIEMDPADHVDDYSEWLTSLAYSPDGSLIAAGHWDGHIFLWDAHSGGLIRYIKPETDFCNAWGLAFSTDGQYLAVGGLRSERDDVIKVFQVSDGSLAWVLDQYSRSGSGTAPVAFSPDGRLLAAGAMDGIYLWALPEYELLHTIPIEDTGASDWVTDLAFSPDSQSLIAGYWDDYAVLWQVQE